MTPVEIVALLGLTLVLSLAAMTAAWAIAWRTGRSGFLDGVWPLIMPLTAGVAFLITEGDPVRKGLLLWLVGVWAAREAWRAWTPSVRTAADLRYAAAAARRPGFAGSAAGGLVRCFLPQGALAWLTALPVQLGQVEFAPSVGWLGWTGAGLAVAGMALAGFGDLRPAARRDGRRWTGRLDYVGDIAVWWGLFLIAAETGPGRWSVIGPVFLTLLLSHWIRTENPRRVSDGG